MKIRTFIDGGWRRHEDSTYKFKKLLSSSLRNEARRRLPSNFSPDLEQGFIMKVNRAVDKFLIFPELKRLSQGLEYSEKYFQYYCQIALELAEDEHYSNPLKVKEKFIPTRKDTFEQYWFEQAKQKLLVDPIQYSRDKLDEGVLIKHLSLDENKVHEAQVLELLNLVEMISSHGNITNKKLIEFFTEKYPDLNICQVSPDELAILADFPEAGACYSPSKLPNCESPLGESQRKILEKYSLQSIFGSQPFILLPSDKIQQSSNLFALHEFFHFLQDKDNGSIPILEVLNDPEKARIEGDLKRYMYGQAFFGAFGFILPNLKMSDDLFQIMKPRILLEAKVGDALSRLPEGILSRKEMVHQAYQTSVWLSYLDQYQGINV